MVTPSRQFFLLLALVAILGCYTSVGVSAFRSFPIMHNAARRSCSFMSNQDDPGLSKIEAAAVQRFTITYDKLCKNCPTRLQPRVDTLAEMILGLPPDERDALLDRISRGRLEQEEEQSKSSTPGARSPRDVYDFQTAGANLHVQPANGNEEKNTRGQVAITKNEEEQGVKIVDAKLLKKMEKARAKFDSNKQKLVKFRRLLAVTNALLAKDACTTQPTIYDVANPIDNGWYHEIDALKGLSRTELKMERLKLAAQRAKCESKVAKGRLKLYKASVDLIDNQ